jgi:hypothetical protein
MLKQANTGLGPYCLNPHSVGARRAPVRRGSAQACVTGRTIGRAAAARHVRDLCPARCESSGTVEWRPTYPPTAAHGMCCPSP